MSLYEKLLERAAVGRPITLGVVGAGQMGTGLVSQMAPLPWFDVTGVADIDLDRARAAYRQAGVADDDVQVVEDLPDAERARAAGRRIVTRSAEILAHLPGNEVIVEATGAPEVGAVVADAAIRGGQHVVMLNVEADVTVGRALKRMADDAGVIYSASAGDEYAPAKELVEFARTLGFGVVCAGKGKNNPLDRAATPDSQAERAKKIGANPWMLSGFVDGTKTAVEMTCLANATGLVPDIRGMHGPTSTVAELPKLLVPREDGGLLLRRGVVDYAIGVAPGVFCVVETTSPIVADEMRYLSMGSGPYWVLFRPYHLTSLETAITVATAAVYHEATIAPGPKPIAEAITMAKRDLKAGEKLDKMGGYTHYALAERADVAVADDLLPAGLANGAVLTTDVRMGEPIHRSKVELDDSTLLYRLRMRQEEQDAAVTIA
ncbi:MAG TPA: SAF domain-containing protein [Candidatus Saccharimonadales bacterium]|nr:SAF domain-containing protein [Candidatus Saccharimonadales bacterium]